MVFFLSIFSCTKDREWDNPWDPINGYPSWNPVNVKIQVNSFSSLTISWVYNSTIVPKGFKIDKRMNEGEWEFEHATIGFDQTAFVDNTVNLEQNIYSYRIYAYNDHEISTKIEVKVYTCIADIDGNYYQVVSIGSQVWLAENLRTTRYNDGTDIPLVTDNDAWANLSTDAYCWYNNDEETYGALYNWYAVNTEKLCPEGWYVPSDYEWFTLENFVDPTIDDPNAFGWRGTDCGYKLKSSSGWAMVWTGYGNGSNDYGFSALPAGYRGCTTGLFFDVNYWGVWWTASDAYETNAFEHEMNCYQSGVLRRHYEKQGGLSVRCIKGEPFNTITDIEGNVYRTIVIGTQEWMAQNLRTTKYNDGTDIPLVTSNETWANLSSDAYCWYNNDEETYGQAYGALYNWYAVNTDKLCPEGWHVPTDSDWFTLENFVDPTIDDPDAFGWRGTDCGYKLKSTSGWRDNGNGSDIHWFSAYPVGYRYLGDFYGDDEAAAWWVSGVEDGSNALERYLWYAYETINRSHWPKTDGISVRCVKD